MRGEAGIGKTCLLDAVASSAADFDVVRLVGIESEMRLGFAALHQLLTPFLDGVDSLPSPQARALKAAFGISDDVRTGSVPGRSRRADAHHHRRGDATAAVDHRR